MGLGISKLFASFWGYGEEVRVLMVGVLAQFKFKFNVSISSAGGIGRCRQNNYLVQNEARRGRANYPYHWYVLVRLTITPPFTNLHFFVGFNVETVEYRNLKFNVWDVGGQDKVQIY